MRSGLINWSRGSRVSSTCLLYFDMLTATFQRASPAHSPVTGAVAAAECRFQTGKNTVPFCIPVSLVKYEVQIKPPFPNVDSQTLAANSPSVYRHHTVLKVSMLMHMHGNSWA